METEFFVRRALQDKTLKTWRGVPVNVAAAQAALHHRARSNGFAMQGYYSKKAESERPVPQQANDGG